MSYFPKFVTKRYHKTTKKISLTFIIDQRGDSERFECHPARILRRPVEKGEKRASRRGYTRIRFGARFMRYTVANNRSVNSAGIVSAGVVHSTPQTLSFESVVPARHRHYHCYHPPPVDVVCTR